MLAVTEEATKRPAVSRAMRSIERAFLMGVDGATEVLLVRHADCYEALDETHDDPSLSPTGLEQARRLGERLRQLTVHAVYSSPMRRAVDTAKAIRDDVIIDGRLVEVDVDSSSGYVEVKEPAEACVKRLRAAIDDAVREHTGRRLVMVSHGVAILNYLCDVLRLDYGTLRLMPYYTSVNVVRILGERRMAGALADIAHLEGMDWPR